MKKKEKETMKVSRFEKMSLTVKNCNFLKLLKSAEANKMNIFLILVILKEEKYYINY